MALSHQGHTLPAERDVGILDGAVIVLKKLPRRVSKAPADAWWRALHRIADEQEPHVRQAFLKAVRMVQAKLDVVNLEDALARGQLQQSALWEALESELDSAMRSPLREALLGGAGVADKRLAQAMRFDITNPAAVRAVDSEVANLVREITQESRMAIRDLVRQSVSGNFDVRQLARQVKASIGLTSRYAVAVERYRQGLVDGGLSEGRALERSGAYADRLLRSRATTIARTEVIRAVNSGQRTVWSDAQREGLLPITQKQVWIATALDACPQCEALDGTIIGINDAFPTEDGPISGPPRHPRCRCSLGLAEETE